MAEPLVSCLMPTMPDRLEMAQRAVFDFLDQTWPNKELIVACSGDFAAIQLFFNWCRSMRSSQIVTAFLPTPDDKAAPLGTMRNFTNELANGEWLATWDDDDRHHPDRLRRHMQTADEHRAEVTYLNQQLHVFTDRQQVWWVDWRSHRSPGYICYRRTDIRYDEQLSVGEDTMFLRKFDAAGRKFQSVASDVPLYVRYFHGKNAWNRRHHEVLVSGHSVSRQRMQLSRDRVAETLRLLKITGPLDAVCPGGVVFRYLG